MTTRPMHKRQLIATVARKSGKMKGLGQGLTRYQVGKVLDLLLDTITDELAAGGAVTIAGFGRFEAAEHAGRRVVAPDGSEHQVEARLVPAFRPYESLRAKVAGKRADRFKRPPRPIPLRWADDPES